MVTMTTETSVQPARRPRKRTLSPEVVKVKSAQFAWAEAKAIVGVNELGRIFGRHGSSVSRWKIVPAECVLKVEELSGISRKRLRPDLYPDEEGKA